MPSGKKARQQRRGTAAAPRKPPAVRSKGAGGSRTRQASPRALAIGGGLVLVVVVAIVLAVVLGKSSGGTNGSGDSETIHLAAGTPSVGSSTGADALPASSNIARMFKGIPENGLVLGKPSAPVELTEFIDLQCPDCQQFETTELPTLIQRYVRPGKLRIKMQPWSILDRTPSEHDSDRGQKATIAAAAQNKAFPFAEMLYANQGLEGTNWMNDSMISKAAASVDGLKPAQLVSDANSAATRRTVQEVDGAAAAGQYQGTPTLLLAKGSGQPHFYGTGVPDLGNLEAAINARLK